MKLDNGAELYTFPINKQMEYIKYMYMVMDAILQQNLQLVINVKVCLNYLLDIPEDFWF